MATMNTSQRIAVTIEALQADGTTPATVQPGSMVWASSDETVVLAVADATDGMTGFINAVAAGGPARVTFTADADMGAGVVPVVGTTEDIDVTADPATQATTFRITLAPAEAKPAATPPAGP